MLGREERIRETKEEPAEISLANRTKAIGEDKRPRVEESQLEGPKGEEERQIDRQGEEGAVVAEEDLGDNRTTPAFFISPPMLVL